jgi:acyl-CoA reductase-like NAD-dependent aldehyde dehydrogenase
VGGGMASKYRHTGQTCICQPLYVQDKVYDQYVDKLARPWPPQVATAWTMA